MTIRPTDSLALRILQQNSRSHEIRFVRGDGSAGNEIDQVSISGQAKQMAKEMDSQTPKEGASSSAATTVTDNRAPMPERYTIPKR